MTPALQAQLEILALENPWTKDNLPSGVACLPDQERISSTMVLPCRVGLDCENYTPSSRVSITAVEDKWKGKHLIECQADRSNTAGNANGNFDTWIRNTTAVCLSQCSGILFRGAQFSGIENVWVWLSDPWLVREKRRKGKVKTPELQTGFTIGHGSRNVTLRGLNAIGFNQVQPDPFDSIGIRFYSTRGVDGLGNNWHKHRYGMVFDSAHGVFLPNQWFERTETPLVFADGSSDIHLPAISIRTAGRIIADFSGRPLGLGPAGGQIRISGSIHASPQRTFYIDRDGREIPLTFHKSHTENGETFDLTI